MRGIAFLLVFLGLYATKTTADTIDFYGPTHVGTHSVFPWERDLSTNIYHAETARFQPGKASPIATFSAFISLDSAGNKRIYFDRLQLSSDAKCSDVIANRVWTVDSQPIKMVEYCSDGYSYFTAATDAGGQFIYEKMMSRTAPYIGVSFGGSIEVPVSTSFFELSWLAVKPAI